MATTADTRRILVTGATGKQGSAVVRALLNLKSRPCDFQVLALTRNTSSAAAQALASQTGVEVIAGDLSDPLDVFQKAGGVGKVWGVFSVTVPDTKNDPYSEDNKEYRQGVDLIDASLKFGVEHFVQTSVDRGGLASASNPTDVAHFITKHRIEQHLMEKTKGGKMTYTILRPVAFMDLLTPDFGGRIFGAMIGKLGEKPLQLVATKDIGIFATQAFAMPETDEYRNTAISLAGDELTQQGCNEAFWKALNRPMPIGFAFIGSFIMWMIPEVGTMFQWFKDVGYGADVSQCRRLNSDMLDLASYLKEESKFKRG